MSTDSDAAEVVLLRNARVIDGSGDEGRSADVLVVGDRIAEVGAGLSAPSRASIVDLDGLVLAPGFIDPHTHFDAQVLWDRDLTPSSSFGVTTVIAGNCGFTIAPNRPETRDALTRTLENVEGIPLAALEAGITWGFESFDEYLTCVAAQDLRLNFGAYVGHTAIRHEVLGADATEREATAAEIERMAAIVSDAVGAGAFGVSSSMLGEIGAYGRPVASTFATHDELRALAVASGTHGPRVVQILVPVTFDLSLLAEFASLSGGTVLWGPALAARWGGPGTLSKMLDDFESTAGARMVGSTHSMPIEQEVSFRDPTALRLVTPAFIEALALPRDGDARDRLFADPSWLERAEAGVVPRMRSRLDRMRIVHCPSEPSLEGRTLAVCAAERGTTPLGLMTALSNADRLSARFILAISNDDEVELAGILRDRRTLLALSDAGAHTAQICDASYALRLLGKWVRELGALRLGEAVHALSAQPAEVLGLRERGRIASGMAADLVAFDPDTVGDGPLRQVSDLPAGATRMTRDAIGVHHVWVNGTRIRRDQVDLDARGGRVLRAGGPNPGDSPNKGRSRPEL